MHVTRRSGATVWSSVALIPQFAADENKSRLVRGAQLAINPCYTHPMREGVKQKHFSTLSVRPRSVLASRPLLRGEDFGFNAWSVTECDRYMDRSCWSPLSDFMPLSRHHRCEAAQANRWLKCQPSSYVRLEA